MPDIYGMLYNFIIYHTHKKQNQTWGDAESWWTTQTNEDIAIKAESI